MKKVLVTGINGFTGVHLAKELHSKGYEVIGLVRERSKDFIQCDLNDVNRLTEILRNIRPQFIVNLAAVSFVGHDNLTELYTTNVSGTVSVLEAVSAAGLNPDKILLVSSANVYGQTTVTRVDESVDVNPVNHYAVSKWAMEKAVALWFDHFPILITRPFNYTGLGQHSNFLIPKIVGHYQRKEMMIELGNLDVSREFSDVRDVVNTYRLLLETDAHSEIVNVCSGNLISLQQVIELMNDIAGYQIDVRINTDFVRENEIKELCGNRKKLVKLINPPIPIPLQNTLRWMYQHEPKKFYT